MAMGSKIICNGDSPKGRFEEGTIVVGAATALFAGMMMEIVPATEPVNGRYTYRPVQSGSLGDARPRIILLGDDMQGSSAWDAYTGLPNAFTSGRRGFLYWPASGDEMNLLLENVAGTSDHFAIGDKLIVDATSGASGYGKFIAAQSVANSRPAMISETITAALTADYYALCKIF